MPNTLNVSVNNGTATIELNDPARKNPLGTDTALHLATVLKELDHDPDTKVIILTGAGGAFSAGGDLNEFLSTIDSGATALWDTGEPWQNLYTTLRKLHTPTIARVDGPAMAGGCGIVALADFAYCTPRSVFGTPEIKIGLYTLFILPGLIRRIGERNALDLSLTGRTISAAEAVRMNLVNAVVDESELETRVQETASQLARIPKNTMSRARHAFTVIADSSFTEGLELARGIRPAFMCSDELRKGIQNMLSRKSAPSN